jgi:hypothetical protein
MLAQSIERKLNVCKGVSKQFLHARFAVFGRHEFNERRDPASRFGAGLLVNNFLANMLMLIFRLLNTVFTNNIKAQVLEMLMF